MNKPNKKENIILRLDENEHEVIKAKASFFGLSKSELLRTSSLSFWDKNIDFKDILKLYQNDEKLRPVIIDIIFEYYRKTGFPHTSLSDVGKDNRIERLCKTKVVKDANNELSINYAAMDLANSFHPHMDDAKYGQGKLMSPMEAYSDDVKFRDCIKRWLDLGKKPNPEGIRRILKTRNGVRGVSNFRPTIAKYMYENYCPLNGKTLDFCSGFSGRLLGCIGASKGIHYYGIDPEPFVAQGNVSCASYFKNKKSFGFSFAVGCAEDVISDYKDEFFDLIFTSPPYFDTEVYSSNKNQSSVKYKTYKEWLDGFLFKITLESKRILKKDGFFAINIKNGKYNIADDLKTYCLANGYILKEELKIKMVNNEYNRSEKTFHTEPIMIFSKL